MVSSLQRGAPTVEQAEPLTVPVLRALASALSSEVDEVLLLSLLAALFSVARADSFLSLEPGDVEDVGEDRVRVCLSSFKGERRAIILNLMFHRLPQQKGGSHFAPLVTAARGSIPLCLVYVFCTLRARALRVISNFAQCWDDRQLIRRLTHLCERAGVSRERVGRNRNLFIVHCTRVGAVCHGPYQCAGELVDQLGRPLHVTSRLGSRDCPPPGLFPPPAPLGGLR